jgi:uncharacterized protein
MNPHLPVSRRQFLQTTSALGVGALLLRAPLAGAEETPRVARKAFGRTGVDVPIVGLGCMFDIINNQVILRQTLNYGVNYWDTAASYERFGSETGIGMFFEKNPSARQEVFLATKGRGDLMKSLDASLGRLKTDHVELFFVHGIDNIGVMHKPEVKAFAEAAKKAGKIKLMGFTSHSNAAQCLSGAADLDWIDAVMFTYSYRDMHRPEMVAALEACTKRGIALTAMKTMGGRQGTDNPAQAELLEPITAKGFTPGQAKLKLVMENPQISCACVQMPNIKFCRENIAAALNRKSLGATEKLALSTHAAATCQGYCAGCSHLCEPAIGHAVPVREVMRQLMYHHHYDEIDARALFADLPAEVRERLTAVDYAAAERVCPNRLPIAVLMREASAVLT